MRPWPTPARMTIFPPMRKTSPGATRLLEEPDMDKPQEIRNIRTLLEGVETRLTRELTDKPPQNNQALIARALGQAQRRARQMANAQADEV